MPFSHHSHSGEFCGHAKDSLEEVVKEAIAQQMQVFCMTEHMPRDLKEDLYEEEVEANITPEDLNNTFSKYMEEATRLRDKYSDQIQILIGMETDWIRPDTCYATIERLFSSYQFDLFVGSVHHVHTIPIDFSKALYLNAIAKSQECNPTSTLDGEILLAEDYFDAQLSMLKKLKPPVVGHFDLLRLYGNFEKQGQSMKRWPGVWQKIERNLAYVKEYGGCLEINSAGLRKGLRDPYPCRDICIAFNKIGGRFVMSDDSHGIAQIGHSYLEMMKFAKDADIKEVAVFERAPHGDGRRMGASSSRNCSLEDIDKSAFVHRLVLTEQIV